MSCRFRQRSSSKKPTSLHARCVCVYHLNRCKTSDWFSLICRGAVNLIPSTAQRRRWFEIVISGLIIPTYLRLYFSDIARGQAKNPNHNIIQSAALLSQSGINFEIYMHQNLPQIFAETISPTVLCFLTYFRRDPVADELWVILGNNRRNIILDFNMLVKTLWNLVMTTFDNFGCPTSFARSTSCGSFIHQII